MSMILPVEKILTIAPEHAAVLALLRSRLLKDGACRCRPAADLSPAALAWAMEQRVVLLLYDGLKRCGGADSETIDALKALYRANAVRSIRFEGELVALHRLFASAGISFMLLKGLALSLELYGDAALRPCGDIDILVRPADMERAAAILEARGYRPLSFQHPLREKFYRRVSHHWEFYHPECRLYAELHQKLLPRSRSSRIDATGLWQRTQTQILSRHSFAVMDAGDLLLYLVVHGAKEHWATLLDLYDTAAWLIRHPQADWQAIRERAGEWRCRRRLRIALALACSVFRVPLPPTIESELQRNRDFEPLYHQMLERLFFASKPIRKIHLFRLALDWRLADGWRDLPALLASKGTNRLAAVVTWRPRLLGPRETGRRSR